MKLALSLVLLVALVPAFVANVSAQEAEEEVVDPTGSMTELRTQLAEVQAKEAELKAREKQIEEDLKPENIERALAGVGSTKPEDMRELRRRQLTIERDGVANQLRLLATSRARLETVIRTAENREYQQAADGSLNQLGGRAVNPRWIGLTVVAALMIFAGVLTLILIRKRAVS